LCITLPKGKDDENKRKIAAHLFHENS